MRKIHVDAITFVLATLIMIVFQLPFMAAKSFGLDISDLSQFGTKVIWILFFVYLIMALYHLVRLSFDRKDLPD